MQGKICVVTGGTSGIGLETARGLLLKGATVAITGRDQRRGIARRDELRAQAPEGAEVEFFPADFARFADVRRLSDALHAAYPRIDVLVNNAALMTAKRSNTPSGFETTFAVNHLAPFLLTALLLDRLRDSTAARIVNVSSEAHRGMRLDFADLQSEHGYSASKAYGRSKLANLLFTFELARRLKGEFITANALHPGVVRTDFGHGTGGLAGTALALARPFMLSPEQGAKTSIFLASSHRVVGVTGKYFSKCEEHPASSAARNPDDARRLWRISEELTGYPFQPILAEVALSMAG